MNISCEEALSSVLQQVEAGGCARCREMLLAVASDEPIEVEVPVIDLKCTGD